jgi:hypothetical protein
MRKLLFIALLMSAILILLFTTRQATIAAGDGIPDNCEYNRGTYYQPNLFPRYEPQNTRLVLVDWATGVDVKCWRKVWATRASSAGR